MTEFSSKSSRLQNASQADWDLARSRELVLRRLAESPSPLPGLAKEAALQLGLSCSSIYRLLRRYRNRPQVSSLLPMKRGRKRQSRFIDQVREKIIDAAIRDFFLKPERPRISDLMLAIRLACREQNLHPPNYRTVARRIKALDPKLVVTKRLGSKAAGDRFGPVRSSHAELLLPLEQVQIDHTLVDVMVVDEQHRRPIQRPWLTLAIDVASRMVNGFHLSLEAPSSTAVALVLTHAVLPKERWLSDRELDVPWPVAGIPDVLHADNAPEFDSQALQRGCEEYGIELYHRPPRSPRYGGHIERLIGTMMGAVHLLPGTTFSNPAEKGNYPSAKAARLTMGELERWLALEIAGVYHQSMHSALGKPPIQAWQEGLARRPHPPRLPAHQEQFFLDFLPGQLRQVRRDGIRLFNIYYWDNVLSPFCGRSNRRVLVKYNPSNLSRVFLQDENGHHWSIPYRDLGLPPVTLWEQREAMKQIRAEGRRAVDEKILFAAILEQRKILESSRKSTRQLRELERRQHLETTRNSPDVGTAAEKEMQDFSDLKPFEVEEWS